MSCEYPVHILKMCLLHSNEHQYTEAEATSAESRANQTPALKKRSFEGGITDYSHGFCLISIWLAYFASLRMEISIVDSIYSVETYLYAPCVACHVAISFRPTGQTK